MALQQNVATRVAYKAHSSGTITANTEPDFSTNPGASSAQQLRRVSSTLALTKDTYSSNEIAEHRQVDDMRHGVKRVTGEISGELSPGTYGDLNEAVFRATKAATFTKTESDFTSLAATKSSSKLTFGSSTWADEDFRVGDIIRVSSASESTNNRDFLITALSTVDATVTPAPTDMTADTAISVARLGNKVFIPETGHVERLFAFEHYHQDIDVTQLFTECRLTRLALSLPSTGLATVTYGVTGRNATTYTSSSSPFFTSPTAPTTTGLTAAVNGSLSVAGTKIGILTALDLTFDMAVDAPSVVGQNIVADIILGRSIITGNATALFQDETILNYFVDETEVEIACWLTVTSGVTSAGLSFFLPRVKFNGANINLQGEGSVPITLPFQALRKPTTTGYDATSMTMSEWTS